MAITFGTNRFSFLDPERLARSCVAAEAAGFDYLWFPDSQLHAGDVFLNLLTALKHTERARAGTLVVNPVTRHPSVTAASIADVDSYAPGRVSLGIAPGDTSVWQVGLRPARLAQMESAVRMIRGLLAGEAIELGWSAPSRLDQPRAVPVIIACGGPRLLRMAGQYADGVVIRVGTDPALIRWSLEEFRASARIAGRDPDTLFTALHFHTVITDDAALASARGRVMAAGYYEVNPRLWEVLNLTWPCAPIGELLRIVRPDFHHAADMELAARMVAGIDDETARRFCLMGTAAQVRAQLERLLAALGWDGHVILQPNLPGRAFIAGCAATIIPAFR
ncbi:MAG: LLM class flavin-dependent oxidoreductase [Candidatus Binataceae bacterium]|nr:LLM class flavin-dependent oxidoreductase [Candidatus Binataceae bacterium]